MTTPIVLTADNEDYSLTCESEAVGEAVALTIVGTPNTRITRAGNVRITRAGNVRITRDMKIVVAHPIRLTAEADLFRLTAEV